MSTSSSSTRPVTQPPSESSCMRLRQRRNVLLPQPDGPMIAVTVWGGMASDTSFTAAVRWNRAVRRSVARRPESGSRTGPRGSGAGSREEGAGRAGAVVAPGSLLPAPCSRLPVSAARILAPRDPPRHDRQDQDQAHQHHRRRPSEAVPLVQLPPTAAGCGDPVDKVLKLGRSLAVNSTPTLILANGERLAGGLSAADLTELLDGRR